MNNLLSYDAFYCIKMYFRSNETISRLLQLHISYFHKGRNLKGGNQSIKKLISNLTRKGVSKNEENIFLISSVTRSLKTLKLLLLAQGLANIILWIDGVISAFLWFIGFTENI